MCVCLSFFFVFGNCEITYCDIAWNHCLFFYCFLCIIFFIFALQYFFWFKHETQNIYFDSKNIFTKKKKIKTYTIIINIYMQANTNTTNSELTSNSLLSINPFSFVSILLFTQIQTLSFAKLIWALVWAL